jgi:hypothetical protein
VPSGTEYVFWQIAYGWYFGQYEGESCTASSYSGGNWVQASSNALPATYSSGPISLQVDVPGCGEGFNLLVLLTGSSPTDILAEYAVPCGYVNSPVEDIGGPTGSYGAGASKITTADVMCNLDTATAEKLQ